MRVHLLLSLLALFFIKTGTALAQVTAPSQGGAVGVTRVTATTMELLFGTTGNGQGRVVAIAPAPGWRTVQLAPVDGTSYLADAEYGRGATMGKGFVVYNGTGHSALITGLQPSTVYYLANAEYNTDGTAVLYNVQSSSLILSTPAAPRPAAVAPAPLPVVLTSFTGEVNARSFATLHWTTATEQNTAYFALERSTDGSTFTEAGQLSARGSSNQPTIYAWADPQSLTYATYYRLRQVDHDGSARYSSILLLAPRLARSVDVFPSPSTGQVVQVRLQGFEHEILTLSLTDALGRQVFQQILTPPTANHQIPLPANLATGTYFLTLNGNGNPLRKHLILSE